MKKLLILFLFISFNAQAERQTVFNDDNYTPREIENTIPGFETSNVRSVSTKQARSTARATRVPINWSWNDGTKGKPRIYSGTFYYTMQNDVIDTTTICSNFNHGSIKKRNCRKAAKQHFKKQCKNNIAGTCGAASMRP